jgi:hypothetical protein
MSKVHLILQTNVPSQMNVNIKTLRGRDNSMCFFIWRRMSLSTLHQGYVQLYKDHLQESSLTF